MYFINKSKYDITIFMICTLYLNSIIFNKLSLIFTLTVIYTLFFNLINNSKEAFINTKKRNKKSKNKKTKKRKTKKSTIKINNIRTKCKSKNCIFYAHNTMNKKGYCCTLCEKSNGKKHGSHCQKDIDIKAEAATKVSEAAVKAATKAAEADAKKKAAEMLERLFNIASKNADDSINKIVGNLLINEKTYHEWERQAIQYAVENPINIETNNGLYPNTIFNEINTLNEQYEIDISQYNEKISYLKTEIKNAKNNFDTEYLKKLTYDCNSISNETKYLIDEYKDSWIKLKYNKKRNQNFSLI
tara:strand:+ start:639 stop:1541 length:903 start_codon:yes stop_codon:yes gene_type:complete